MIFELILTIVTIFVKIILWPIDALIKAVLPEFSGGLTAVGEFLQYIGQGLGWAISAAGIPFLALSVIATYYLVALTLPVQIWGIKLAVKWYRALKL